MSSRVMRHTPCQTTDPAIRSICGTFVPETGTLRA